MLVLKSREYVCILVLCSLKTCRSVQGNCVKTGVHVGEFSSNYLKRSEDYENEFFFNDLCFNVRYGQ